MKLLLALLSALALAACVRPDPTPPPEPKRSPAQMRDEAAARHDKYGTVNRYTLIATSGYLARMDNITGRVEMYVIPVAPHAGYWVELDPKAEHNPYDAIEAYNATAPPQK